MPSPVNITLCGICTAALMHARILYACCPACVSAHTHCSHSPPPPRDRQTPNPLQHLALARHASTAVSRLPARVIVASGPGHQLAVSTRASSPSPWRRPRLPRQRPLYPAMPRRDRKCAAAASRRDLSGARGRGGLWRAPGACRAVVLAAGGEVHPRPAPGAAGVGRCVPRGYHWLWHCMQSHIMVDAICTR